jgi:predicted  nucleic acid-binding Zn-ribbon protein
MMWFNRFMIMSGLVSKKIGRVALFVSCFGLCVSPSVVSANVNVQLANLKQDMELVSRQVVGLRSEVELLRRENAQLRVSVEQLSRRQNSASGSLTQQVDTRLQALERRASQAEKEQIALQKNIDQKLKDLIADMNKAISQVNKSSSSASSAPSKTFSSDYPQKGFVHKVERGETVSSVALKYKSKIKWIIDANQIGDPTKVFVGKELFVPQQ